jgi:hypothetical protein
LPDPLFSDVDNSTHAHNGLLGWHRTDLEGLSLNQSLIQGGASEPVSFAFDGVIPGVLLYQDIWLPPGHYKLVWQPEKISDAQQKLLSFSITCGDASHSLPNLATGLSALEFVIPENCVAQRLQLNANGANLEGEPIRFRFGGIHLSRL